MKKFSFAFMFLLSVLMGFLFGVILGDFYEFSELNKSTRLLYLFLGVIFMYVGIMLHMIIHEAGHLVFGLMSGYKFSSFRVGSFMLKKEDDRLVLKRFTLAGTGGQCLMSPPDLKDGRMPFVMYNLGGVLFNVIISGLTLILMHVTKNIAPLFIFFFVMTLVGIYLALVNGIPMRTGELDNDGMNIISLSKDSLAVKAMWTQLKINECTGRDISLKDMPDEWFELPEGANTKNVLISSILVFKCNKLMAERRFDEADAAIEKLLNGDAVIVGIYKSLLKLDKAYIEMIGENRRALIDALIDKQEKNIIAAMKNLPSIIRFQYAYALLVEKDSVKAHEYREQIETVKKNYPYKVDVEDEMSLMDIAENIAKDRAGEEAEA